ncbi:glycosyltransferase family 1 protein, partial [bacterium]
MGKINILYVITKLELGGAQKHLLSLIANLDKSKFNIFLFTSKEGLLLNDVLAISGLYIKTSPNLTRPINFFKDLPALFEIYSFIRKHNIDIVHTHSSKAGIVGRLAARLAKVKIIIHTVHGWPFNDYQRFIVRYIYIWLERLAARLSDKLIIVSCFDKKKGLINR